MEPAFRRVRVVANRDTAFWWDGAAAGELRIQRCVDCGRLRHPPRPMCPRCNSLRHDTVVSSGRGTVHSFVTYRHQPASGLKVPYVVLVVALEEGVRVIGNLVGAEPEDARVGMPVEVVFLADDGDDLVLPQWRPRVA
jgi:uncharacterized protein